MRLEKWPRLGPKLWPGHGWEWGPGKGKKASLKPPPNAHTHTPGLQVYERGEPPPPGPLSDVAEPLFKSAGRPLRLALSRGEREKPPRSLFWGGKQ